MSAIFSSLVASTKPRPLLPLFLPLLVPPFMYEKRKYLFPGGNLKATYVRVPATNTSFSGKDDGVAVSPESKTQLFRPCTPPPSPFKSAKKTLHSGITAPLYLICQSPCRGRTYDMMHGHRRRTNNLSRFAPWSVYPTSLHA